MKCSAVLSVFFGVETKEDCETQARAKLIERVMGKTFRLCSSLFYL